MQNSYQSTLDIETRPEDNVSKALDLKNKSRLSEAFELIEDDDSFDALVLKGEIKSLQKNFKASVEYLDCALKIENDENAVLKKADALYQWAKVTYFPEGDFNRALDLISLALEIIPDDADSSELWFLKGEIHQSLEMHVDARRCFLKAEGRIGELEILEGELDLLESHRNDILINVAGVSFYEGLEPFGKGEVFDLRRDAENEHDRDAIAVVMDEKTVGYVANSDYTVFPGVQSASDIRHRINDSSKMEVVMIFQGEFVIGKVMI